MKTPPIVSPQDWEAAREELLVKEKELTRALDAMAAEADAVDGRGQGLPLRGTQRTGEPGGPVRWPQTADRLPRLLCAGRHHLSGIWRRLPRSGLIGCSFGADQVAHPAHLNARDTTLVYVSRAPQAEIQGLKQRMGWELILGTHSPTTSTRISA